MVNGGGGGGAGIVNCSTQNDRFILKGIVSRDGGRDEALEW
jgi:hypothetical protein